MFKVLGLPVLGKLELALVTAEIGSGHSDPSLPGDSAKSETPAHWQGCGGVRTRRSGADRNEVPALM